MKRPRDSQRHKVYASDRALERHSHRLEDVRAMDRFVRRVWKSRRVQARYPRAFEAGGWLGPPGVRDGRGHRNATGGPSLVTMPRWARSTHILLHELAHTICSRHYPRNTIAPHGWQFAECYAYLVKLFMGADAHDSLRAAYWHNGVRSRPPRKRAPLSPERRAELTAQLAAARERRKELERPAPF